MKAVGALTQNGNVAMWGHTARVGGGLGHGQEMRATREKTGDGAAGRRNPGMQRTRKRESLGLAPKTPHSAGPSNLGCLAPLPPLDTAVSERPPPMRDESQGHQELPAARRSDACPAHSKSPGTAKRGLDACLTSPAALATSRDPHMTSRRSPVIVHRSKGVSRESRLQKKKPAAHARGYFLTAAHLG